MGSEEKMSISQINGAILGVGLDIVSVKRIQRAIQRDKTIFLDRIFSQDEVAFCERSPHRWQQYSANFAAKEGVYKAMGTGLIGTMRWKDVEVDHLTERPQLRTYGQTDEILKANGVVRLWLSLSFTESFAVASVILERGFH